jgi:hypothetical protein
MDGGNSVPVIRPVSFLSESEPMCPGKVRRHPLVHYSIHNHSPSKDCLDGRGGKPLIYLRALPSNPRHRTTQGATWGWVLTSLVRCLIG